MFSGSKESSQNRNIWPGMKINFSHWFCCIAIETNEVAGQHDWDDYEFQVLIEG